MGKHQDIDSFLLHSEFFWRYIFRAWVQKYPAKAKELIQKVRQDEEAEVEVLRHLEKVSKG